MTDKSGSMKLIQGNCMDYLDEKPDLVLSDPPYNIGFAYNEYDDAMAESSYVEMLSRFKLFRTVFIHYPEEAMRYFVPALGVPNEVMVWCYNSNIGRQSRLINFFGCKPDRSKVLQPYKNPNDKRVAELIRGGERELRYTIGSPTSNSSRTSARRSPLTHVRFRSLSWSVLS